MYQKDNGWTDEAFLKYVTSDDILSKPIPTYDMDAIMIYKRWLKRIICTMAVLFLVTIMFQSLLFLPSSMSYAETTTPRISIINFQSYPKVGGLWTVSFKVEGTADLIIQAFEGTVWDRFNCPSCDLLFKSLQTDGGIIPVTWENGSVIIKNFTSSSIIYETSQVLTSGKHVLKFIFGDAITYAYNDATNWWDSNWGYRKKITINNSQVQGSLKNFPVLVNISDDDLKQKAEVNGNDIAFISYEDNTTKYHHEIENYTKGNLTAWINITRLSSITDTHFWMYYGNPFCDNQENVINTWNSNYVGVWHLNETSGNATDSTSNHNDGTLGNTPTQGLNGKIGKAYEFTAINEDYIELGTTNMPRTDGAVTLEVWAQYPSGTTPGTENLVLINNGSGASVQLGFRNNVVTTWKWGGDILVNSSLPGDGEWHQYVFTTNGSTHHLYVNGVQTDTSTESLQSAVTTEARISTDNWGEPFNGIIDEVRISNTARNHSWIATSYNNIENQNEFIRVGEEESAAPIVSDPFPSDGDDSVARQPSYFEITVFDPNPELLNITWRTNQSGAWETFNETNMVLDGTYQVTNTTWVTTFDYMYWWSVNVTDGTHWTNETYGFCMHQYSPMITSFSLSNETGNKLNNQTGSLSVNNPYSFLINITDLNGWNDITFVNITCWYDFGDDTTRYNETLGGNLNMFFQYENTTGSGVFRILWPTEEVILVTDECSETIINDTTRVITISFQLGYQMRYATSNDTWDITENVFNDPFSWNINCSVSDAFINKMSIKSEFGIQWYASIEATELVEITGAPGMTVDSTIMTISYSCNSDYKLILYLERDLIQNNGGDLIGVAGNLSILASADEKDDITHDVIFTGVGESHAITLLLTTSPTGGMSNTLDVQFSLDIPFGTWGTYSSNVAKKIIRL